MELSEKVSTFAKGFAQCGEMLSAIGDETRQHLILEMLKTGNCQGLRVGEITEKTNLSRPAVSHHMQILRKAGIAKVRKEGTKNYYYFDPDTAEFERLISTLQLAREILGSMPSRSGDGD